jgi:hypothetical protein
VLPGLRPQDIQSSGCNLSDGSCNTHGKQETTMPKLVIEREIVGAGKLPRNELQAISQKSCGVLQGMGPQIQWVQSYVTEDKIYCVYIAANEDMVRSHAQKGGFPANSVARVRAEIDPTTAEA